MKLGEMIEKCGFEVANPGENRDITVGRVFCCDLLSIAMGRLPAKGVWVTVMANINTLAVATLTEAACVILAEGVRLDEPALEKARLEKVTVLCTELPVFEAATVIQNLLLGRA